MEHIIVFVTALAASALTFFSGFGLGTLLLPVFALFFSIEEAIILTAIVHLLNNIFKTFLMHTHFAFKPFILFIIPASTFAYVGAYLFNILDQQTILTTYTLFGNVFEIYSLKLIIGIMIILFSLFDLLPKLKNLAFEQKYLPIGGAISGFFGGLSGHQGALRSAFLIKLNLQKEVFISTGILIAVVIDLIRLFVYDYNYSLIINGSYSLLYSGLLGALIGAIFGKLLLKKVTINQIQTIVGVLLIVMGFAIAAGVIH